MKHIYAVQSQQALTMYSSVSQRMLPKLEQFLVLLHSTYHVTSQPRCIVWTDMETATELISNIPIPAYTNDYRTVFCPELDVWKEIYLRQLESFENREVREYYETHLTENHVLQILGHEFVHHSEFFPDCDRESGIWFEEGMCEYISRKFFLTDSEFQEEARINALLVSLFQEKYGQHPLEEFGSATYDGDYASIFYEYWRSFLAVQAIVEAHQGDVIEVLQKYRQWLACTDNQSLAQFFRVEI